MNRFLRYWLPLIAYCLILFLQSNSESPVDLPAIEQVDKVLHAGAYGLLGILFYRAYRAATPSSCASTERCPSPVSAS